MPGSRMIARTPHAAGTSERVGRCPPDRETITCALRWLILQGGGNRYRRDRPGGVGGEYFTIADMISPKSQTGHELTRLERRTPPRARSGRGGGVRFLCPIWRRRSRRHPVPAAAAVPGADTERRRKLTRFRRRHPRRRLTPRQVNHDSFACATRCSNHASRGNDARRLQRRRRAAHEQTAIPQTSTRKRPPGRGTPTQSGPRKGGGSIVASNGPRNAAINNDKIKSCERSRTESGRNRAEAGFAVEPVSRRPRIRLFGSE